MKRPTVIPELIHVYIVVEKTSVEYIVDMRPIGDVVLEYQTREWSVEKSVDM